MRVQLLLDGFYASGGSTSVVGTQIAKRLSDAMKATEMILEQERLVMLF